MLKYSEDTLAAGVTPASGDNTSKLATDAWVVAGFAPQASPVFTGTSKFGNFAVTGSYMTGNVVVPANYGWVMLTTLSANGTVQLPASVAGQILFLSNQNVSAFLYSLTGSVTVLDTRGVPITVFSTMCSYTLLANAGNWIALGSGNLRSRDIGVGVFAGSFSPQFLRYDGLTLSLGGNCTISAPVGMNTGDTVIMQITNTGNFAVTWSGYKSPGGYLPINTKGAGTVDLYSIYFDGTNYILTILGQNTLSPVKVKYGNMSYKKNYFTALTDFTQVGTAAAPTIVNGAIRLSGGNNDYTNYLTLNGSQNADQNMDIEVSYRWVAAPVANAGVGIAVGRTSINAFSQYQVSTAIMDYAGYKTGMIVATNAALAGNIGQAGYPNLAAVGDICRLKYSQRGNTIFGIYENFTQAERFSFNYFVPFVLSGQTVQLPNSSKVAIYNIGGSIDIIGLEVSSQTKANPYILAIGDSKTLGYGSVGPELAWVSGIQQLGLTDVWAGGADNTAEILATIQNAITLNPTYAILCVGRNDLFNGVAAATYQANYTSIVTALTNAGIQVLHLTPIPETTQSQTALDTWVRSTYAGKLIDSTTGWVNGTHLGSDNTHPNVDGHRLLANTIINSGQIPASGIMSKNTDSYDPLMPGYNS